MVYTTTYRTMMMEDSYKRYLTLSKQQENLHRKLSIQSPISSPEGFVSMDFSSGPSSPTLSSKYSYGFPVSSPPMNYDTTSVPIPTMPGYAHGRHHSLDSDQSEDSKKLFELNQQIKATLTELLNTESVKHDDKARTYVQDRLMNAEKELKQQRRRRSSVDRAVAQSIAEHFPHSHSGSFGY